MKDKEDPSVSEIIKRIVSTGIGAAFLTEETVKSMLKDLPIPKQVITGLIQNAKVSKEEFVTSIKNEFKKYLKGIDISKEIENIFDKYEIEVNAKLNFNRREKPLKTKKPSKENDE